MDIAVVHVATKVYKLGLSSVAYDEHCARVGRFNG